jgi:hypothetical protein
VNESAFDRLHACLVKDQPFLVHGGEADRAERCSHSPSHTH